MERRYRRHHRAMRAHALLRVARSSAPPCSLLPRPWPLRTQSSTAICRARRPQKQRLRAILPAPEGSLEWSPPPRRRLLSPLIWPSSPPTPAAAPAVLPARLYHSAQPRRHRVHPVTEQAGITACMPRTISEPPAYTGTCDDEFSVQVHHGYFFRWFWTEQDT